MLRPANMGEDEEQCNDEPYVEDTPPDWGDSHEDLNMAESQGSDQQSSDGEEADSPANQWPWGPEGRPSDTGRSQGVLAERPAEPAREPPSLLNQRGSRQLHNGGIPTAEPTLARGAPDPGPHGPIFETTCVADKGTTVSE